MNDENEKKPLGIEREDHGGENGDEKKYSGTGMALGMCFGSALGMLGMALTGEFWWVSVGVAVGSALGLAIGSIGKSKK